MAARSSIGVFAAISTCAQVSPVLRRILMHPDAARIPHLSIIAGADTLIASPVTHALPGGDVRVMEGRGHNTLLFDEETARMVEARVLERRRICQAGR